MGHFPHPFTSGSARWPQLVHVAVALHPNSGTSAAEQRHRDEQRRKAILTSWTWGGSNGKKTTIHQWIGCKKRITLWLFNIAMENGPFMDDFPLKQPPFIRDFPWLC
jgi:hypothetical protein